MQASPEAAQVSALEPAPRLPSLLEALSAVEQAAAEASERRQLHEASLSKQAEGRREQGTAAGGVDETPSPSAQPGHARAQPAGAFPPSSGSHASWDIHGSATDEPTTLLWVEDFGAL